MRKLSYKLLSTILINRDIGNTKLIGKDGLMKILDGKIMDYYEDSNRIRRINKGKNSNKEAIKENDLRDFTSKLIDEENVDNSVANDSMDKNKHYAIIENIEKLINGNKHEIDDKGIEITNELLVVYRDIVSSENRNNNIEIKNDIIFAIYCILYCIASRNAYRMKSGTLGR
jgi:hypothetical protein